VIAFLVPFIIFALNLAELFYDARSTMYGLCLHVVFNGGERTK
jgi:hypothetical protein